MVGGSLRVLRLLPSLKHDIAEILLSVVKHNKSINQSIVFWWNCLLVVLVIVFTMISVTTPQEEVSVKI